MKSIFTVLFISFCAIWMQAQEIKTEYPATIPEFEFIKIKGDGIYKSSDIKKNKKTLIGFVSPECIHCLLSLEHLNNNISYLKDINVILVTEYEKDEFMNKFNSLAPNFNNLSSLEILRDSEYEFGEKFKPLSLPTFYLFDKNGKLETVKRGSIEVNQIFQHLK